MSIDPKEIPALDDNAWDKPDTSRARPTVDFINDLWASRNCPVYSLRPVEFDLLTSPTLKGWLWRLILKAIRRRSWTCLSVQAESARMSAEISGDVLSRFYSSGIEVSDQSMRRYIEIASKWPTLPEPPEPPAESPTTCGSTRCDSSSFTPKPPRKPRKKTTKKPAQRKPR